MLNAETACYKAKLQCPPSSVPFLAEYFHTCLTETLDDGTRTLKAGASLFAPRKDPQRPSLTPLTCRRHTDKHKQPRLMGTQPGLAPFSRRIGVTLQHMLSKTVQGLQACKSGAEHSRVPSTCAHRCCRSARPQKQDGKSMTVRNSSLLRELCKGAGASGRSWSARRTLWSAHLHMGLLACKRVRTTQ
jgi:hypothetical protein